MFSDSAKILSANGSKWNETGIFAFGVPFAKNLSVMEINPSRQAAVTAHRTNTQNATRNSQSRSATFESLVAPPPPPEVLPVRGANSTAANSTGRSTKPGLVTLGLTQGYSAAGAAQSEVAPPRPGPVKFNLMQQNWMEANTGAYANLLVNNVNRTQPYTIESVNINWVNGSSGVAQSITRAVGNVDSGGGAELAALLGGTLVVSPFNTFGTSKKDQYIRMGNGQMIDASVLANNLNQARNSKDPVAATQNILNVYRCEAEAYNLNRSTDALDLVTKGQLTPWSPNPSAS